MTRTGFVLTVIILATQQCFSKNCVIWTEPGSPVQRGSSLSVFCHFPHNCSPKQMTRDHALQTVTDLNESTISLQLVNITEMTVFICECHLLRYQSCGLDLAVGYPPDRPENMSCSYTSANTTRKDVHCTWDQGRRTYIPTLSNLWVELGPNRTERYPVPDIRVGSAIFPVPGDATNISVRVRTQNKLGVAESVIWTFALSDIAKPLAPVLCRPHCSARLCTAELNHVEGIKHLEIQHKRKHQKWETVNSSGFPVSSLRPNTVYYFRARWKFRTGLWSEWSAVVWSRTEEEAPARALDVWWTEQTCESLQVYWKEMNSANARGKILNYKIEVENGIKNISADKRNTSVPFCPNCRASVSACNSKGCSPPVHITCHRKVETHGLTVQALNNSLSLSWPQSTPGVQDTVVEWHREGHKLDEIQWLRPGIGQHQTVVADVQPFQCYEGAVHEFYQGNIRRTATFRAAILETVPTGSPSVQDNIEGSTVTVTWTEVPQAQRGGCVIFYNIYLENSAGFQENKSEPESKKTFTWINLPPASYSLRMSASTAKGEGPIGGKIKFFISADNRLSYGLVFGPLLVLLVLFMLWLCPSQKLRLCVKYFCEVVPDPANSQWAKEHFQEKGFIDYRLCVESAPENVPVLAIIEQLPEKTTENMTDNFKAPPLLYPLTSYIKSHSHDSESSGHTEQSQDTTVEYISSPQPRCQEEDDEEFDDMLDSFSGSFTDSHGFGGNLSLDAVKMNCGEVF